MTASYVLTVGIVERINRAAEAQSLSKSELVRKALVAALADDLAETEKVPA